MSDRAAAVFLDKDGTLLDDVPYNVDPVRMRFTPGAEEGLRLLHAAGFRIVLVSNQSGVARGLFPESALSAVERKLDEMLGRAEIPLAGFYYCPHHPKATVAAYRQECVCRKPSPGMLFRAARELDLDLSESWMVGDILDDVAAGIAAGCRTVLIANGNETEWVVTPERWPHVVAVNLAEAAHRILGARREVACR